MENKQDNLGQNEGARPFALWREAEGLVFDLDGTLLNTIDDLALATNRALEAEGYETRSLSEVRSFVGNGIAVLLEKASGLDGRAAENQAALSRLREAFDQAYDAGLWICTRPYEGITDVLALLRSSGKKLAVLSNKPDPWAKRLISHFFPSVFMETRGQTDGRPRKPDPAALRQQLADLGLSAEKTLYLGDSEVDMRTAKAAGVHAVGTAWGFRSEAVLREAGADELFLTPAALAEFLRQLGA